MYGEHESWGLADGHLGAEYMESRKVDRSPIDTVEYMESIYFLG